MKTGLTISAASLETFRTGLQIAQGRVEGAAQSAFQASSQKLFMQVLNSTPRITGTLARSGRLTDKSTGELLRSVISFGDDSVNPTNHKKTAEYAPIVHEVYNEKHPGSYKWLERTVNAYGNESYITDLALAIRSALG